MQNIIKLGSKLSHSNQRDHAKQHLQQMPTFEDLSRTQQEISQSDSSISKTNRLKMLQGKEYLISSHRVLWGTTLSSLLLGSYLSALWSSTT